MKRISVLFLTLLLTAAALTGCKANVPQDTTGGIAPGTTAAPTTTQPIMDTTETAPDADQGGENSGAVKLLQHIWEAYGKLFSAYGGSMENAVDNAPGALDVTDAEEMTNRFLIPQEQLASIQEGASLVHMMNSNIFTAAAVKIADDADARTVHSAWREAVLNNQWICGQPDRLLMADMGDGYIIMIFGSEDILDVFEEKLTSVYDQAKILYNERVS